MKRFGLHSLWLVLVLLIAACSSGNSTPTPNNATLPLPRFEPYPEEFQILGLTNAFRAQARTCGAQQFAAAPALTWVEAVGDTAWFHSNAMSDANTENHVGDSTVDRLRARGFDPGATAENRKRTALPPSPQQVFDLWTADPEACANIMNPQFTVMGAGMYGFYEGGNANLPLTQAYWTQILTTPRGPDPTPPSLTVNPTAATATVGGAPITFSATINTNQPIAWALSANSLGSISNTTGTTTIYTPPATGGAGTAILCAASANNLNRCVTITINAAPTPTLTMAPTAITVTAGGAAVPFSATLANSNSAIVWSLTGPGSFTSAGATASYTPPPAPGAAGTATLTATAGTLTASATITINAAVTPTLTVTPPTATVSTGGAAIPFSATLTNSAAAINWSLTGAGSLSATTGATVNYTPPTGGAAGTATLTATAGALTASATITINAIPSLSITPPTTTVAAGSQPITLTAIRTNSTDAVSWSITGVFGSWSSGGSTFTYTPPASAGGTATVTATAGALTAQATITVTAAPPPPPPAATLTISPTTATSTISGEDVAFSANLTGSNAPINWTVSGPGDMYNKTGTFTWYMAPPRGNGGTVTVTATAGNLTASATITLNPAAQPFEQAFLALINQFRSQPQTCQLNQNGQTITQNMPAVPPVALEAALNRAAQLHSEDMANNNFFSHTGLNGSTFSQRILAQGYTGSPQGENIAGGSATAQGAFNNWRNSTGGHCQGMMSANANEIGIGHAINGNSSSKHLWTLVFGRR